MVFFYCEHCCQECKNVREFKKHIQSKNHHDAIKIYNATLKLEREAEIHERNERKPKNKQIKPIDNELSTLCKTKNNMDYDENYQYVCDYCGQKYIYKKSYDTHIDKCYGETIYSLQSKITESTARKLIKLLSISKGNKSNNITNITNNSVVNNNGIIADTVNTQNIQNNIINIFPFGNEDLSMLTDEVKINIYKRGFTAYENLLNEIYKHDQNKNIYIANQRDGIVKFINENKELEIGYIKDAIEKLYDTKKDILLQIIDEYRGTQNKHAEKRIDDLEKAISNNSVDKKYYTLSKLKLHQISASSKQKLKEIEG